ncbi:2-oxo acid dehydrogenase subunit E2 [Vibrio sp. JC009]|uniref:dihydrolipoamide acetyltransferase family protein n=1 Tax=Vibrio sp. JC009 TaxID=2912314 RepID=UPI0023B1564B|nr:dihydrolipoamide acetyltransferase family protein [Vibrio sp. JC009]WED23180.1 2-oxo acid dehydrogenase subunit E2 [Vibrio sp. JC009]
MTQQTHDLTMPAFGADMATGTLIEWQVEQGQEVRRGDIIAVIETNKGAIELDIFEDTVIEGLLVEVGEEISVGTPIAKLRGPATQESEDTPDEAVEAESEELVINAPDPVQSVPEIAVVETSSDFILASPGARYAARQNNINLAEVSRGNTSPVTLKDLTVSGTATETVTKSQLKPEPQSDPEALMRQAISDTVTLSKQTIPHYYLSQRLDITKLQEYLIDYNGDKEPEDRLLLAAPLITAVARLLAKHKALNGQFINGKFVQSKTVHLAHAVNIRGKGLIMPVIRDAQTFNAITVMQTITRQVAEARRGMLPMSQLTGATCCVSSIGERGAEQMSAIIQPPQVAIIALGSPHQEPLVINNQVEIRDVITSTLAADHRVSDGHVGAKFLYQLNQLIQKPEQLWTVNN